MVREIIRLCRDHEELESNPEVFEHAGRKYVREEAFNELFLTAEKYKHTVERLEPFMPDFGAFLQKNPLVNKSLLTAMKKVRT